MQVELTEVRLRAATQRRCGGRRNVDCGRGQRQFHDRCTGDGAVPGGWGDAPAGGENATGQIVAGMRRIPIDGLSSVNADAASDPHAVGRAIALVPATIDGTQPVEILLHLHGFNIGYRQRSGVAGNTDPGTVRDKLQDQLESQVAASGRSTIALLPQGYVPFYTGLKSTLDTWFKANAPALGGNGSSNFQALASNYQVVVASPFVGHDKIVGSNLQAALGALP